MCEVLELWRYERPIPKEGYEDYIFIGYTANNKGRKYTSRGTFISGTVQKVADKAKVGQKVNPYDLRASVITEEFNHYINPKTIQRKARHRNQLTTQRYNRIDDEMVREYVNYNLIFDKPSLCDKKTKTDVINFNLYDRGSPQDINNMENEDNTRFSFSFSLFNHTTFFKRNDKMGLGFLPPNIFPFVYQQDVFTQPFFSSQEVFS